MASDNEMRRLVGLDIGTHKVAAIVGEVNLGGEIEIIGIGTHTSRGMKKGVVVNIESTVQSIQRAIEEANALEVPLLERNLIALSTIASVATR